MSGTPGNRSPSAQRLAIALLTEADREFFDLLQRAGRLDELDTDEMLRIGSEVRAEEPDARRAEMLELYFSAGGDAETAKRRSESDRFLVQHEHGPMTARGLVLRISQLAPELESLALERVGGDDGPLALRSGDHFAAVLDDYDEETEQADYNVAEAEAHREKGTMVTVRGLIHAANVLLDKAGTRERFLAIRTDLAREIYLSLGITEAIALSEFGLLEDEQAEDVMDLGAW